MPVVPFSNAQRAQAPPPPLDPTFLATAAAQMHSEGRLLASDLGETQKGFTAGSEEWEPQPSGLAEGSDRLNKASPPGPRGNIPDADAFKHNLNDRRQKRLMKQFIDSRTGGGDDT